MSAEVLVVTPTLGRRDHWFTEAVSSLAAQTVTFRHVVVAPEGLAVAPAPGGLLVPDPGKGLSAAFDAALAEADGEPFLYWLNDDDRVAPGGLDELVGVLRGRPEAAAVVGAIDLIDAPGRRITTLRGGALTTRLLPWGPGMMASPGVLYRADVVRAVGGLDPSLVHAGDLDLLLRIAADRPIAATRRVVGAFRWHDDSLTVADAAVSLREAEEVRRAHHAARSRRAAVAYAAWRPLARLATRTAKAAVTARAVVSGGPAALRER